VDLATLIAGVSFDAKNSGVTYRQGIVISTGGASIKVGGTNMAHLPRLSTVSDLVAGDVVAILVCNGTYLVLGKIIRP